MNGSALGVGLQPTETRKAILRFTPQLPSEAEQRVDAFVKEYYASIPVAQQAQMVHGIVKLLGGKVADVRDIRVAARFREINGVRVLADVHIEIERNDAGEVRQVYVQDAQGGRKTLTTHVRSLAQSGRLSLEAAKGFLEEAKGILEEEGMTISLADDLNYEIQNLADEIERSEQEVVPVAGAAEGVLPTGNLTLIAVVLEARADSVKREIAKIRSQMERAREEDAEYEKWLDKKRDEVRQQKIALQKKIDTLKAALRQALTIPGLPAPIRGQIEDLLNSADNITFMIEDLDEIGNAHEFERRLEEIDIDMQSIEDGLDKMRDFLMEGN